MAKVDDRVTALITALGERSIVLQTLRSPEAQAAAIASGASQWTGDPAQAPHPSGRAVDMQPKNPPAWDDTEGWLAWAEEVQGVAKQLGLDPRWGGHWYPIHDGDPYELLQRYRAWKKKEGEKPFWDPVHWDFPNDGGGVYLQPDGFRRAKAHEVTAAMRADAQASLVKPIGSFLLRDGYAVGLEHHSSEAKGRHKGASIFIPSAQDIDTMPEGLTVS